MADLPMDQSNIASEGATTGSAVAQRPQRQPRRKQPFKELNADAKLLADYMVNGCPHDSLAKRVDKLAGEPLTLIEAGQVLGMRRRQARFIAEQPVWHKYHAGLLQAFREGHKAEALRTVVQVMRAEGEGKAADRKVRLTAAAMLAGDSIAQPNQTNVSVNVGVGVAVTPGYVIDLSGDAAGNPDKAAHRDGQRDKPAGQVLDLTADEVGD